MNTYTATLDSIGDWDGQEAEAVACWNRYIAPALLALEERLGDADNAESELGDVSALVYARNAAWEAFCDTNDAESFPDLGQRVASMVDGWFTQFCAR